MVAKPTVTVVVNSSYIPSHPSTLLIEETLHSLSLLGLGDETPLLIVQDALREEISTESQRRAYKDYLTKLNDLTAQFKSIRVLQLQNWAHINGALRKAMEVVTTDFVLVIQHDLKFTRPVDLAKILENMATQNQVRHLRFNKNHKTVVDWDAEYEYRKKTKSRREFIEEVLVGESPEAFPAVQTLAWSDNNYLCQREYLTTTVFRLTGKHRVPPEHLLNPLGKPKNHRILGTFIYGHIDDPPAIAHLDGRHTQLAEGSSVETEIEPKGHWLLKHLGDAWMRFEGKARMAMLKLVMRFLSAA